VVEDVVAVEVEDVVAEAAEDEALVAMIRPRFVTNVDRRVIFRGIVRTPAWKVKNVKRSIEPGLSIAAASIVVRWGI
jgi:hypothetical protein